MKHNVSNQLNGKVFWQFTGSLNILLDLSNDLQVFSESSQLIVIYKALENPTALY